MTTDTLVSRDELFELMKAAVVARFAEQIEDDPDYEPNVTRFHAAEEATNIKELAKLCGSWGVDGFVLTLLEAIGMNDEDLTGWLDAHAYGFDT